MRIRFNLTFPTQSSVRQAPRSFRHRSSSNILQTKSLPLSTPAAALPRTSPAPTLRKSRATKPGVWRRWLSGESVRPHDVLRQHLVVLLIWPVEEDEHQVEPGEQGRAHLRNNIIPVDVPRTHVKGVGEHARGLGLKGEMTTRARGSTKSKHRCC